MFVDLTGLYSETWIRPVPVSLKEQFDILWNMLIHFLEER